MNMSLNPYFRLLNSREPDDFFGPKELSGQLRDQITRQRPPAVCLLGLPSTGKSTLLAYLASEDSWPKGNPPKVLPVLVEYRTLPSDTDPVLHLCRRYLHVWDEM